MDFQTDSPRASPNADPHDHPGSNPASRASRILSRDLGELKEYAAFYLSAKLDRWKVSLRTAMLYAALGVVGAIVGGAMLITAAVLVVVGIAQGLTRLFGGYEWAGNLVTGIALLVAVGLAAWLMARKITNTWRSRTVDVYEQRKREQRERFGEDVASRAAQQHTAAHNGG